MPTNDYTYRAGTATERVTPDEPLWLAGYAVRRAPARGTLADLYASALALEDADGGRLVIASIDLIAITKIIADPVYEAVQAATGLPRERLILAATHTHYGPEFRPDKALFFDIPPEFAAKIEPTAQKMADALVRVILAALNDMQPATLHGGRTTAGFAHNRRRQGVKDGHPSPDDVLDQDVSVLWVRSPHQGQPVAAVFGYACHNTTIPPEDLRYSGDWAGVAKRELARVNEGLVPLFITGCGADQNPEPRGSVELSARYGLELAEAVQRTLAQPAVQVTGAIRVAMGDVPLPLEPLTREAIDAMVAAADDPPKRVKGQFLLDQLNRGQPLLTSYPAPMQVVRLGGELLMIVMSGETVVDWSLRFKREFAHVAPLVWVSGYCNDMYGYVPTRRIQREGGYEGGRANLWSWVPSPFAPDVEDTVAGAIRRLVERVSG